MLNIRILQTSAVNLEEWIAKLRHGMSPLDPVVSERSREKTREVFGEELSPHDVVDRIVRDVRSMGDEALLEYARKLDGAELTPETIRVPAEEIVGAAQRIDSDLRDALRNAVHNVRQFQEHIKLSSPGPFMPTGARIDVVYHPLRRVGLVVPGGAAIYPSSLIMTAVPAQVAGVTEIAIVTPPDADGRVPTAVLATCDMLGLREVYRVGGAHAVAALAFGTETIPRVDKIAGPGNIFVTLAKKAVFGYVQIDMLAGPSEILVMADDTASPAFVAADMLSQAEHEPGRAILVTPSEQLAKLVMKELDRQVARLPRAESTRRCLEDYSYIILVRDTREAVEVANMVAPEHLEILMARADAVAYDLKNAGAIFVGPYTPEPVGDYVAGPSHVLPTGGTARMSSGLSVNDFLRRTSVMNWSKQRLDEDREAIIRIAETEGLTAHANAVRIRFES